MPANTSQVEEVVEFIKNIGDSHAMPLPGRLPNYKDSQVMLLPTDMTKAKIFREYQQTCQPDNRTTGQQDICGFEAN